MAWAVPLPFPLVCELRRDADAAWAVRLRSAIDAARTAGVAAATVAAAEAKLRDAESREAEAQRLRAVRRLREQRFKGAIAVQKLMTP